MTSKTGLLSQLGKMYLAPTTVIPSAILASWRFVFLFFGILLVGCGALNPPAPTATPDPLAATVKITFPPEGAVIYADALKVSGTLSDALSQNLTVQIVGNEQQLVLSWNVTAVNGTWSAELIHDLGNGDNPQPATVQVVPADHPTAGVFDSRRITFAPLSERPDGKFVNILSPEQGREVGGDTILVTGTISGYDERAVTLELVDSNSAVIDSQTVTWDGGYPIDEIPFSVELTPGETVGNAVIRVLIGGELQTQLAIIISDAAG